MERINSIRNLFAIKFANFISKLTLFINIDESSINRDVKSNYSWGFKGFPIEVNNTIFADSASLIMAIWSDGSWISLIVNEAINSTKFVWFLKIMGSWLKSHDCFGYSKIAIILENWAIHKSATTRNWLEKIECTIFFIPAYSPDFAPVEFWFSIFKRKLTELLNKE